MNLLEEIIWRLPQSWQDKAYNADTDGMGTANCGSLEIVHEYIMHLEKKD